MKPAQQVREKVLKVREIQMERAGKINAYLNSKEIERDCKLCDKDAFFLENALNKLGLSVRAYHRILKVSRTIADLQGEQQISQPHLAEALGYRAIGSFAAEIVEYVKTRGENTTRERISKCFGYLAYH